MAHEPTGHNAEAADIDLYCLHCGYNLRGLAGDPRRCPECGKFSPVGLLKLPARVITQQLTAMESVPATCVLAILTPASIVYVGLLCYLATSSWSIWSDFLVFGGITSVVCAIGWIQAVVRFKAACCAKPGWESLLARYHAVALISLGGIGSLFGATWWLMLRGRAQEWAGLMLLVSVAGTIALIFAVRSVLYRPMRAKMDQMQREVAVRIARDRLRRDQIVKW